MTLKEQISRDFLVAFKQKLPSKTLLTTLKGEIQTAEKNLKSESISDEEVIKILNKFAKNLKETLKLKDSEDLRDELAIIESYLPKLMSEEEIQLKINELLGKGITNLGLIMKEFSTLPVDKKLVSELVKKSV
jgi:uncharacterized protein YqeY